MEWKRFGFLHFLLQDLLEGGFEVLTGGFFASLSAGGVRPHAGTRKFVKMQSVGARGLRVVTFDAIVEFVANGGIFVGEKSISTRTRSFGLRRFWNNVENAKTLRN